ncbi:MAG: PAS domain S-box protein [Gammaproteobacteria bacterium]
MTASNNLLTPEGIRQHIYQLIFLVVILGMITGVYVSWQKSLADSSQSLASDYHLNSSSHYLRAMLELRHIQGHNMLELLEKSNDTYSQKISLEIQHEYSDTVSFYLVRDELDAALDLQEKFADDRFDPLTNKLQQQLFIFVEGDNDDFSHVDATTSQMYLSVREILNTLKQLVQLHTVAREDLLAELEARKNRQNIVFIALLFLLLGLGFFIIRRSLLAIDSVIIAHNRVEKALFESEKHYRNLVETTAAVAFEVDLSSMSFTYISPQVKELTGFPVENWIDFDFWVQCIHPDDRDATIAYCQSETAKGLDHTFEYRMLRDDGHVVWVRDVVSLIKEQGQAVALRGFIVDITDRKQIELEIKENEQWLIQLLNTLPNGVMECDAKGRIIFSNVAHHRILAVKQGELVGKNVWDFQLDENSKQETRDYLATLVAEKPVPEPYVISNVTRDGNEVILEIIWDYQYDENGEVAGFISIISDITELRQTELALRRSQKMDAVGQMAGGIAHDFNNILSIVLGNIEMLEREITVGDKAKKRIEGIKHSAHRAVDLTRQLLGFSRNKATSKKVVNINQRLEKMQSLIVRALTPQVEVSEQLAEELWSVEIDPGDFEDALLNLLLNARDAMSGNGRLTIETRNCEIDQAYCDINPGIVAGKYVQLAVSDTGIGLSSDVQEHIFEPFFTTKPQGEGTGLGLAMVYGFIKRCGGCIKVYSESGIGTTFRLFLPAVTKEALADESISGNLDARPRGVETVLLVDDEVALLELAAESLQMLGYRVLTAANGKQALSRLAEESAVDLLFSDVVMPGGINGFELAEQAVALLPDLKVLLTSGYTEKAVIRNGQARFNANMLSKPYTQVELAYRVREALDDK